MEEKDIKYYMKHFVKISFLYRKLMMDPAWEETEDFYPEKNVWDSISLFLKNYAYERNVMVEKYKTASLEIIRDLKGQKIRSTKRTSTNAWKIFKKKLGNRNLNHKNNPLCPWGTEYPTKEKGKIVKRKVKDLSIIEFVTKVLKNENLILWCKEKIEKNKIKEARDSLKDINGIGDKIASLFLRDVFIRYFGKEKKLNEDERILLQPIDEWLSRIVNFLNPNEKKAKKRYAEWIVKNSEEPARFNQGAWFFCAQIAHSSKYLVEKCLNKKKRFENLVTDYISNLKTHSKIAEEFENDVWNENR